MCSFDDGCHERYAKRESDNQEHNHEAEAGKKKKAKPVQDDADRKVKAKPVHIKQETKDTDDESYEESGNDSDYIETSRVTFKHSRTKNTPKPRNQKIKQEMPEIPAYAIKPQNNDRAQASSNLKRKQALSSIRNHRDSEPTASLAVSVQRKRSRRLSPATNHHREFQEDKANQQRDVIILDDSSDDEEAPEERQQPQPSTGAARAASAASTAIEKPPSSIKYFKVTIIDSDGRKVDDNHFVYSLDGITFQNVRQAIEDQLQDELNGSVFHFHVPIGSLKTRQESLPVSETSSGNGSFDAAYHVTIAVEAPGAKKKATSSSSNS